jgi:hypothetical protein
MMWMNYRYPGEVVVTPGGREVEKIGKPAVTWFDRLFEWVDDSFQKMARRAAQRGWRGGGWWGT